MRSWLIIFSEFIKACNKKQRHNLHIINCDVIENTKWFYPMTEDSFGSKIFNKQFQFGILQAIKILVSFLILNSLINFQTF